MKEPQQSQNRKWRWFKPTGTDKAESSQDMNDIKKEDSNDDKKEDVNGFKNEDVHEDDVKNKEDDHLDNADGTEGVAENLLCNSSEEPFASMNMPQDNVDHNNHDQIDVESKPIEGAELGNDLTGNFEKMAIDDEYKKVGGKTIMEEILPENEGVAESSCMKCLTEQVHMCNQDIEQVKPKKSVVDQKIASPDIGKEKEVEAESEEVKPSKVPEKLPEVQLNQTGVVQKGETEVTLSKVKDEQPKADKKPSNTENNLEVSTQENPEDETKPDGNKVEAEKEKPDPKERLTKYLAFMKLWQELYPEEGARKEGNKVWKTKIERGDRISLPDYLEQVSSLRSTLKFLQHGDSLPDCDGAEFTCVGADASVQVAGSFSDWAPVSLTERGPGDWGVSLPDLAPGRYLYKFVVDGQWIVDPSKEVVTDSSGHQNNVVVVEDRLTIALRQIAELRTSLAPKLEKPWRPFQPGLGLCPV